MITGCIYRVGIDGEKALFAEVNEDSIVFLDPYFRTMMEKIGIQIPSDYQKDFCGNKVVYYNDPKTSPKLFLKVFKDIYFPRCLSQSLTWEKV